MSTGVAAPRTAVDLSVVVIADPDCFAPSGPVDTDEIIVAAGQATSAAQQIVAWPARACRLHVISKPCLQIGLQAAAGVTGDSPNVCSVTKSAHS